MITKESVQNLPTNAGIYIFRKEGIPIYIGKSINIKGRVLSHIMAAELSKKEELIVTEADTIEGHSTVSEFDALILEAKLIKKHRPKYNVIWKDGKHFLYIKITRHETYPKVSLARAEDDGKSLYYGPFGSTKVAESLLRQIRKIVPFCLRQKVLKRACFYSKIGLCNPCPSSIEMQPEEEKKKLQKKYQRQIRAVIKILSGDSARLSEQLEKDLKQAVERQDFEEAIVIRKKLLRLTQLLSSRSFETPMDATISDIDTIPRELNDFLESNFTAGISEGSYRIECYDISNLQGTNATGSMVVYEDGGFARSQYRRFRIKTVQGISDFDMHKEVLSRRLKKREKAWRRPDLIIIDGGKPQVQAAMRVLEELEEKIPLIGLAKKPDRLTFPPSLHSPTYVKPSTALFKVFQALRDESHRFAKKYHLLLRSNGFFFDSS